MHRPAQVTRPGQTRWSCSHSQVFPEAAFPTRWYCPCCARFVNTIDNFSASKCVGPTPIPFLHKPFGELVHLVMSHITWVEFLTFYPGIVIILVDNLHPDVGKGSWSKLPSNQTIATPDSHPVLPVRWFCTRRRQLSRAIG